MPAIAANVQKHFKVTVENGLLQATVEVNDEGHWLMCCPLCGCIHQLLGVNEAIPYTPLCQTLPILFKTQQTAWHKLYPDTVNYKSLQLVVASS